MEEYEERRVDNRENRENKPGIEESGDIEMEKGRSKRCEGKVK